jgi:hypothetical protein
MVKSGTLPPDHPGLTPWRRAGVAFDNYEGGVAILLDAD